jgi:2-haloacid dehalogenase
MLKRRKFIGLSSAGIALGALPLLERAFATETIRRSSIKAIAFDAFPIFDPRPIVDRTEALFPGSGAALSNEWRTRQFEYTWLRMVMDRYADFWQVTQDALEFAVSKLQLKLSSAQRDELMNAYLAMKTWPDVLPALTSLRSSGFRLAFLSNFTSRMLEANIKSAGLSGLFEHAISTDQARTYKPDPQAYQLGTHALRLERREILFVAFAGWDAAGAKLFGYPTFWLNRQGLPLEKLDSKPDATGDSLLQLVHFLT